MLWFLELLALSELNKELNKELNEELNKKLNAEVNAAGAEGDGKGSQRRREAGLVWGFE